MIYIVEDDLNIRQMESYALRNSGYDVMEFDDSRSFFAQCEKRLPQLVLLDIMLTVWPYCRRCGRTAGPVLPR